MDVVFVVRQSGHIHSKQSMVLLLDFASAW